MIQNDLAKISLSFVMLTTACEFLFFFNLRLRVLLQNESIKNITFLLFQHGRGGGPVMSLPRKEKRIEDSS